MHVKATAVTVEDDSDDNIPEEWKQSSVDSPATPPAKQGELKNLHRCTKMLVLSCVTLKPKSLLATRLKASLSACAYVRMELSIRILPFIGFAALQP